MPTLDQVTSSCLKQLQLTGAPSAAVHTHHPEPRGDDDVVRDAPLHRGSHVAHVAQRLRRRGLCEGTRADAAPREKRERAGEIQRYLFL